jgi:uncharacterized phage protein (TIGR01671 family)
MKISDVKYKVWDKKNKKMYKVLEISFDDDPSAVVKRAEEKVKEIIEAGGHHCSNCDQEYDDYLTLDDNTELLRFTGTCDKNGKEVYEGDVLWEEGQEDYWTVVYGEQRVQIGKEDITDIGGRGLYLSQGRSFKPFYKSMSKYIEVIGNIYENMLAK